MALAIDDNCSNKRQQTDLLRSESFNLGHPYGDQTVVMNIDRQFWCVLYNIELSRPWGAGSALQDFVVIGERGAASCAVGIYMVTIARCA